MSVIEVDPKSLSGLGIRLKAAAQSAGVAEALGKSHIRMSVKACGDEEFASALARFLKGWGHGAGHLKADAQALAEMLSQAGAVYLEVEAALAGETL